MTKLKKKLTLLLITVLAAVCIGAGIMFIPDSAPSADTAEVTLSLESQFVITDGVFTGLTSKGTSDVNGRKFAIRFPATVKKIGTGVSESSPTQNALFGELASKLISVSFSGTTQLTEIGAYAFKYCSSLESVVDLNAQVNLKTIGEGAFKDCSSLLNISLPSQVDTFANELFSGCSSLRSVTTSNNSISVIGEKAFENCYNLKSFKFPDNLTTVGASAFAGCQILENISLPDSAVNIGKSAFARCAALKSIRISDGITKIDDYTFDNCNSLARIYTAKDDTTSVFALPSNINYIGINAFNACISLTEIVIPKTVKNINERAFYSCSGVHDIYFYAESVSLSTGQTQTFGLATGSYTDVTLHIGNSENQVKNLPPHLFAGHTGLKEIIFNNVDLSGGTGENGWGTSLFSGCTSLEKVTFKSQNIIPLINKNAFSGCINLSELEGIENIGLGDNNELDLSEANKALATIEEEAFANCRSLRTFTIGPNVSSIKTNAFNNCRKLVEVKNLSTKNLVKDLVAGSNECGLVAYYALRVYKDKTAASYIDDSTDYIFYADTVDKHEIWLLDYVGTATNITLPSGYGSEVGGAAYNIYNDAFLGKTSLTEVIIPDLAQIREIRGSAFAGCTSLTSITFPSSLLTAGDNLLQGCTSLTNVNFNTSNPTSNTGINIISAYMFSGCTSLKTITLPRNITTIEYGAFENCTALTSVTFGGGLTGNNKVEKLTTIDGAAFRGCSSLEVIEIPSTVTSIGQSAFAGCTSLRFVYLPTDASYGAGVFEGSLAGKNDEPLIIISKSKESYNKDKEKDNLADFANYLTYIIDVKLIYNDGDASGGAHKLQKLYNRDAGYEKIGLVWNMSASMPAPDALFVEMVWYKTDAYEPETRVELADFTNMLKDDSKEIVLYSHYEKHPSLLPKSSTIEYDPDKSYTIEQIFTELLREKVDSDKPSSDAGMIDSIKFNEYAKKYQFNVISHTFANGDKDSDFLWDTTISDAGTYVLEIKLQESYGTWATPYTVSFVINRKRQDISKVVVWGTESGALGPDIPFDTTKPNTEEYVNSIATPLYFDENGTVPYATNAAGRTVRYVIASCAPFKLDGNNDPIELEIFLKWLGGVSYGEVVSGSYSGNNGSAAGTYTATAVIKPDSNYLLDFTSDAWTRASGLDFSRAIDGTVTVTKTWYIYVDNNNRLVVSESDSSYYSFGVKDKDGNPVDWVYGKVDGDQVPKSPSVLYGSTNSLVTYSLAFNGQIITGNEANKGIISLQDEKGRLTWGQYINSTLPAGDYVLTFYIKEYFNGSTTYGSDKYVYEFTVKEATVGNSDRNNVINSLRNTEIEYTGNVTFIDTSGLELFKKNMQVNSGVGIGYWDAHPEYYTQFEARYYVVEAGKDYPDKNYYTAQQYIQDYADGIRTRAFPVGLGKYTIYYIVDAPNYEGEISGSYTLTIQHTLKKIVIDDLDYTGVSVLPDVDALLRKGNSDVFDEYSFLDVYTLTEASRGITPDKFYNSYNLGKSDEYKSVGRHYVFVSIKNSCKDYVVWDKNIGASDLDDGYILNTRIVFLVIRFEIVASGDMETEDGRLYVNSWEYGMFSADTNAPHWKLVFNEDASTYKFQLISEDKSRIYYFNNNPDEPLDGLSFNSAPAGRYTLKAISPADPVGGWGEFTSEIDMEVKKATLAFRETPYIDSWNYGNQSSLQLPSLAEALVGFGNLVSDQVKIYYCLRADYDNASGVPKLYNSLDEMKNSEGHIPAGEYYVIYRLDETDNFAKWEYKIRFKVLQAINSWKSLYMPDFDYVDYNSAMALRETVPNYGEASRVFVQFRRKGDNSFQSLDNLLNIEGKLDIGQYEMRAMLPATDNFARMESITTFTVSRAQNTWIDVPSIRGWAEGNYDAEKNGIIAKAAVGQIELTITDKDGNECSIHDLGSLKIGTYKLTARVKGTNNYDELVSEIYFDVIEDSVGMKGLIAATVVFSVLAIGLAAAAIVFLVMKNKKAEREFRKAVRNELRRK